MPLHVEPPDTAPQDHDVARAMEVLGSPVRLALLRHLRAPKTLSEIELRAGIEDGQGSAVRPLARQTIRDHLDRLLQIGAVVTRPAVRERGPTVEYLLNHQALFAIAEELREMARLRPASEPRAPTFVQPEPPPPFELEGPCLVLVKGLEEGRTFDVKPPTIGTKSWVIGRRRGLAITLDFDPFVSTEHAVVTWEDGSYFLRDLPESRNGTLLNFKAMPKEMRRALKTGDLVGVGHSILMFQR